MAFLKNKKILIFGIKNYFSIAWGIAVAMHKQKAKLAFAYHDVRSKKKIEYLAKQVRSEIILKCDLNSDNSIKKLFKNLHKIWGNFDGIVHSIAYVPQVQLNKNYVKIINRKDFLNAHELNSFSLVAIVKEAEIFLNDKSVILTLSYIGAIKYVPYYNIMGIAKASLEANVRYLSVSMGKKNIRVNAISSGPVKTVSAYRIKNFHKTIKKNKNNSPLRANVTTQEIGNVAAFLCSDLSSGITGQIIYVDNGNNIL
ncbi:Enoyl-[acyl-carrier-protein] reductase [NADH] FabI [Buchnera aphidicola (Cinara pseudotaxifoliae)]|uniref:Enoyl-[acyl-carrier-protein] reductase [NADH] n=1 Tax=Buchnera aphidicola (Cinara pseudotaxifoliae) TaxID=655384 RepID=A0A451DGW0_9GAMM|nr:enoyl-ACP reductase [Buchnera aphidicola]VFP85860.1 Enoyl-[acyl-carrier-protein] reductase [NADH] FabI [Buchnera aphidicola (Cinara pseudotaxifoliae)]